MCGFCCFVFIEFILTGKTLLDNTNLFSPNNYKNNGQTDYKYFKDKYDKKRGKPRIQTKKLEETKIYPLEKIKHNNLMSKNHKKMGKNLNYVENLLILTSAFTGCV